MDDIVVVVGGGGGCRKTNPMDRAIRFMTVKYNSMDSFHDASGSTQEDDDVQSGLGGGTGGGQVP